MIENRLNELANEAWGGITVTSNAAMHPTFIRLAVIEAALEGMRLYAWWQDGVEMVGTCGTTLKDARVELIKKMGELEHANSTNSS